MDRFAVLVELVGGELALDFAGRYAAKDKFLAKESREEGTFLGGVSIGVARGR